ncbi:hypothetical protein E5083_05345 [Streptomyces bauhiniae]|uniref:Uncharacterized protein n=1 Tax=Streptomyces bauhiniae TaxID=2340725 RepID=A0A4Z1DAS3_9ACTN|nr:hypothetical protein [Streptomyces bauhiniae]TGN79085.1 hypothetical protein E5083_05345 [Streptomyces bauhiniae]
MYELDSYTGADEDSFLDEEVEQAAAPLHRSPDSNGAGDDEDAEDDNWRAHGEAQQLRINVFKEWRRAAASLHRAQSVLDTFPWLKSWADSPMKLKAEYVASLQKQAARLVSREALLAAARIAAMDTPELPSEEAVFSVLGNPTAVGDQLRSLWRQWRTSIADSWDHPREYDYLTYRLVHKVSSRRKGRDGADPPRTVPRAGPRCSSRT